MIQDVYGRYVGVTTSWSCLLENSYKPIISNIPTIEKQFSFITHTILSHFPIENSLFGKERIPILLIENLTYP